MKEQFEVGDLVKATSKYAWGPDRPQVSPHTVIGIITSVKQRSTASGVPWYRIGDGWFYASEMEFVDRAKCN